MRTRGLAALLVLFPAIASCHAVSRQKALAPVPDSALFRNLRVLPQNVTREQLIDTMRAFTRALDVHCDHCHVRLPGSEDDFDFPSDGKPEKETAREMMRMTSTINEETIFRLNPAARPVRCVTCHRGKPVPELDPTPPAPAK